MEWIANDHVQSEDEHRVFIASGVALVAEHEDQGLVAFLNAAFVSNELHIWQIAVHRDHQGQSIGRTLIAAARRVAIENGARALTLTTFRDVPWNEPYYKRLGFKTLAAGDIPPHLAEILDKEAQAGLPPEQRCAMVMPL